MDLLLDINKYKSKRSINIIERKKEREIEREIQRAYENKQSCIIKRREKE